MSNIIFSEYHRERVFTVDNGYEGIVNQVHAIIFDIMSKRKATKFTSDSAGDVFNSCNGEENVICLNSDSEDSGSVTIIEPHAAPSSKKFKTARQVSTSYGKKAFGSSSAKQERNCKPYRCSSGIPKTVRKENAWKKAESPTSIAQDVKPASLPSEFTLKAIEEASDEEKKENDVFHDKFDNFFVQWQTAVVHFENEGNVELDAARDYTDKLRSSFEFFLINYYPWKKLGHSGWGECEIFKKHVAQLTRSVNGFGPKSVYLFAMIAREEFGVNHKFEFGPGTKYSTIYINGFSHWIRDHHVA
ncbi:predicted protein [Chaetoceros tenuissimus]|uniref:Uncharacterized protein n=1 Tax=Chaetoceros tenuissimus TaxID=426638 RepID=A0AAD3CIC4_9STRA|nr:predicted protein [Chaetoceros tenuissimus]